MSGSRASLRGVAAVSPSVAWASGANGTILRTIDGGVTWTPRPVPAAEELDFRDIEAFDAQNAIALSIGPGSRSRIYKTVDGGDHWTLLLENPEPKGFFDAVAFWNSNRGIVMGDPVDGQIFVALTNDGGTTWTRNTNLPASRPGEGAFAASGTCLLVGPEGRAWMGTGGPGGGRVFRSTDYGRRWEVSETPVRHDNDSSGIFSLAFRDALHGVIVGGDYAKPGEATANIARTADGGKTWTVPKGHPGGFRSVVRYLPGTRRLIAAGTSGIDISSEDGQTWTKSGDGDFNAASFATAGAGWAVGPKGAIARWQTQ